MLKILAGQLSNDSGHNSGNPLTYYSEWCIDEYFRISHCWCQNEDGCETKEAPEGNGITRVLVRTIKTRYVNLNSGDKLGIIGRNGAVKTTYLNDIVSVLPSTYKVYYFHQ
ncbi:hypothetical protein GZH82_04810 [Staphylococcus ursi]|uniref:hypothetical protein n=1 Tax=Staphylococcus sp. MI 10-1553 TaxID=1912064 RepID=UPI001397988D|nr:hypothetical protein [Staphylococcus sp. MI 10-1553]QHW36728.1 hypothetical protein GZH82_04810 [Staphylococcus sp. MI 10-1553]